MKEYKGKLRRQVYDAVILMYGERADDEKHLTGIFIKACAVSDLVLVYIFFVLF